MSESQATARYDYYPSPSQPSRDRLAYLLAQLSELDLDGEKKAKLEAAQEKKVETRPRLEPVLIRKPATVAQVPVEPEPAVVVPAPPTPAAYVAASKKLQAAVAPARKPVKRQPVQATSAKPAKKLKVEATPARKTAAKTSAKPKSKLKPKASFHTALRGAAKKQPGIDPQQLFSRSAFSVALTQQRGILGSLARGWAWLNSKAKVSSSKRLRLSEVVSMGDKRFVALVKVEDREFLIGGAASGLSLLASLDGADGTAKMRLPANAAEGNRI